MKVFVVIATFNGLADEQDHIDKIFDNEEKAKAYVKEKNNVKKEDREYTYDYYEYEVE
jgi:hypothetical protein